MGGLHGLAMGINLCQNSMHMTCTEVLAHVSSELHACMNNIELMDHAINSLTGDHVSLAAEPRSQGLPAATSNGMISTRSSLTDDHVSLAGPNLPAVQETSCSPLDEMMTAAYGDKLKL